VVKNPSEKQKDNAKSDECIDQWGGLRMYGKAEIEEFRNQLASKSQRIKEKFQEAADEAID
jgi:hypothetical protein